MKIYDISQEVFSCAVFPGDIPPERVEIEKIEEGSICNLTGIKMCAHNGTHVDAPYHFYKDGKTIDEIAMEKFVGKCYVSFVDGDVTAKIAEEMIKKVKSTDEEAAKRLLIGGNACVTIEAAKVFAENNIYLVGNESQTVGPLEGPAQVHYELLKAEIDINNDDQYASGVFPYNWKNTGKPWFLKVRIPALLEKGSYPFHRFRQKLSKQF